MERTKRQRNSVVEIYHSNKKRKLRNEKKIINTKFRSRFEYLPNETIYEIFEYMDIYQVYRVFFNLNKRFQDLLMNSNLPIQINVSTMSKSNFEHYYNDIILPNKHRINILRLSNPFIVDNVFSPPRIITKFIQLETLIFHNIDAKYLHNILNQCIHLPKLHSLVLNLTVCEQIPDKLFYYVFRLPKLKYFQISKQVKAASFLLVSFDDCEASSIEHLVIKFGFLINSFSDLLRRLPKLCHLSIDYLVGYNYTDLDIKLSHILLKDFKYLSLNISHVLFSGFEKLVKHYFRSIEVLRIKTNNDQSYLNANQWEELILSSMPNLRIFDFNHDNDAFIYKPVPYHDITKQFASRFWIERQWFFTYQQECRKTKNESGIFYSTNPYRRKDYIFYWQPDTHLQENNLNSVKHLHVRYQKSTNNFVNYFPNVTELTIDYRREISNDILITNLDRIVPVKQLTKLAIYLHDFPFDEFLKLLCLTPNLHTLKFYILSLDETSSNLSQTFKYVSKTNKITNLELLNWSTTFEEIKLILNLFPQIEYLKIAIDKKEIEQIIRFLFFKPNNKPHYLFFLCIARLPKRCLKQLNMLMESENLLDDYLIKFVYHDLYLWW